MKKGINYWAFPPQPDGSPKDVVEAMREARDIGFDCFEPTVEETGIVSLSTSEAQAEKLRMEADSIGIEVITLASGLAWSSPPTHPDPEVRDRAVRHSLKIVEIAAWLGAETILYLPGMVSAVFVPDFPPQPYDFVYNRAREALERILPEAEKRGVRLGIENVWNRFLLSPLEMRAFIDSFGSPAVGSYFDVGNIMLTGHPDHWIDILGQRVFAVHLKDFRVAVGNLDGFVDLLSGDVDFRAVMAALGRSGYEGPLTAEIVPSQPGCIEKAFAAMAVIEKML